MVPDRQMDPYFAEFVPLTKEMEPKAHMHPGSEFLYVLEGELESSPRGAGVHAGSGGCSVL
jgi:quercetin dioxygenase-like cupin family protein